MGSRKQIVRTAGPACWLVSYLLAGCVPPDEPGAVASPASAEAVRQKVNAGKLSRKTLKFASTQPARIAAHEQTPLFSRIPGYVSRISVDIGDRVEKGQELVQLAVPELDVELRQKEALVAQAQAEIKQAEAARRTAEAVIEAAKSKQTQAEAAIGKFQPAVERSKLELTRIEKLAADGSVSQKLVDEARNQLQVAEAAVLEAKSAMAASEAEVKQAESLAGKAAADRDTAEARQRVAEANRDYAQTMRSFAVLTAPFDGVITRRDVDPGHSVAAAGNKPLLVLARIEPVRIQVDVPELDAGYVDIGDSATVRVQALRDREFPGRIARTSWSLDEGNRSLRVEIELKDAATELRPGMFAVAQLHLAEAAEVFALPAGGVVREGGQTFVCLVSDGKIVRRAVQLGLRAGDEFEVAGGLTGDEVVVLARADGLKEGQAVEIEEPKK